MDPFEDHLLAMKTGTPVAFKTPAGQVMCSCGEELLTEGYEVKSVVWLTWKCKHGHMTRLPTIYTEKRFLHHLASFPPPHASKEHL